MEGNGIILCGDFIENIITDHGQISQETRSYGTCAKVDNDSIVIRVLMTIMIYCLCSLHACVSHWLVLSAARRCGFPPYHHTLADQLLIVYDKFWYPLPTPTLGNMLSPHFDCLFCLFVMGALLPHRRFTIPPPSVRYVDEASPGVISIHPWKSCSLFHPSKVWLRSSHSASPTISTLGDCRVYRPPPISSVGPVSG